MIPTEKGAGYLELSGGTPSPVPRVQGQAVEGTLRDGVGEQK